MAFDFSSMPRRTFPPDLNQLEAKEHRIPWSYLLDFKRRHSLPCDQRLNDAARALLDLERETANRVAKGEQVERAQALALIAKRATAEATAAVAAVVPDPGMAYGDGVAVWVPSSRVEAYLLNRVEALTGKRYSTAGAAWRRAAVLVPAAAPAAQEIRDDPFPIGDPRDRLILFWGVILRLDQLEGPPPADPAAFYRWCQLEAYQRHVTTASRSLADVLSGQMGSGDARGLLMLPESGPLDPGAIRSAYRAEARKHHPDVGGDRRKFERLIEARDRLLLEVA